MLTPKAQPQTAHPLLRQLRRNWELLLFVLPAVAYLAIFHYWPIYGIQIAFRDFKPASGIWGSAWVGLKHFTAFFESIQFLDLLRNTLLLSVYALVAGFPVPILLALILHYAPGRQFKKVVQTVTYAPHFISVVVLVGMLNIFFATRGGFVNELIRRMGFDPILFMGAPRYFRGIYVLSGIWQSMGWGSILYIAVLSSLDTEIHDAAVVDGASKLKRIWYIDLPQLMPTVTIMLILSLGGIMNVGFEKVYLMQNNVNIVVSEVIATYVYKIGLISARFSYSTAIGLFGNAINLLLLLAVNEVSKRLSENSLW